MNSTQTATDYDLITLGRCGMDLFAQNIGAAFEKIQGFDAHIGGSPTNIAVAASRLGLKTALLTAVGPDLVGDFVLDHLAEEGVDTGYIPRKPDTHTGLAVVGVQPPDRFPLVFFRQNPADIWLTPDDLADVPFGRTRCLLLSGTALSRGTAREATIFASQQAAAAGATVYLDLDLRPDQWPGPESFRQHLGQLLPWVDVVIGTEEEAYAAFGTVPERVFAGTPLGSPQLDELERVATGYLSGRDGRTLILKRGGRGASLYSGGGQTIHAHGFPVHVLNTVGAGDAFAGGLIYARCQGWDWHTSARFGNANGALVVTRHGCAAAMPRLEEISAFVTEQGGL
jgi:5-dehydro-2-deoxygluconokinase